MLFVAEGPVYPESARVQRLEGFVTLAFDVTASGNVDNVRVINSEPAGVFDNAAIAALRDWQFLPMQRSGTPVLAEGQVSTLTFKLSADEKDGTEASASNETGNGHIQRLVDYLPAGMRRCSRCGWVRTAVWLMNWVMPYVSVRELRLSRCYWRRQHVRGTSSRAEGDG